MSSQSLLSLSSTALYISFFAYLIAIIPFGLSVKSTKKIFSRIGISLTTIGFVLQLVYFATRWYVAGHAPVSNMYEFMTFFGIMLIGSFLIMYYLYRQSVIGLFALPIALLILGFANAFSKDVSPLIPALQSHWLTIHVITVAFSSAVLSISFVTGIIFLLKTVNPNKKNKQSFFLELVMYFMVIVLGFICMTSIFSAMDYTKSLQFENRTSEMEVYTYKLPAITVPKDSIAVDKVEGASQQNGLIEIPNAIHSQKLNTII